MTVTGDKPSHFPVWLTLAVVVVFAVCVGLGDWQLQRAAWKTHELRRIAALKRAPPVPIAPMLARAAAGEDITFTRVAADCEPGAPAPAQVHMVSDNGEWVARVLGPCHLSAPPYDGVVVDRGFLTSSRGSPNPPSVTLPAPAHLVGVLYPRRADATSGLANAAPYMLAAEQETPAAPGVAPAAYPGAGDNLQYVGAYWLTWFGLAGAVACVYAAMLWRRTHPKPVPPR
jgi:surfeit locus 1 family protein